MSTNIIFIYNRSNVNFKSKVGYSNKQISLLKLEKNLMASSSYRLISLINYLCKLMEQMINNRLSDFIEEENKLDAMYEVPLISFIAFNNKYAMDSQKINIRQQLASIQKKLLISCEISSTLEERNIKGNLATSLPNSFQIENSKCESTIYYLLFITRKLAHQRVPQ